MTIIDVTGSEASAQRQTLDLAREPLRLRADARAEWHNFKDGVSFDEAAQLVAVAAQADGEYLDLGVGDLSTWVFGPAADGTAALAPIPLPGRPPQAPLPLRSHAFGQVCAAIGAPAKYVRGLPGKLAMACMNHGLRSVSEKSGLVRLADGEVRALVSDRYAALDNEQVVDTLRRTLRDSGLLGETRVRAVATGPSCSFRLTFPAHDKIVRSPQVGDVVEVGLDLLNGELGNRAVSITPLTWRLVCLNGMRRADREVSTRLRHIGDPERLVEAFRDAVPAAIASSHGLRERMERAVDVVVDDLLGEFDLSAFGLSAGQGRDVARDVMAQRQIALPSDTRQWGDVFAQVGDVTVYDVMNGITHVAQTQAFDARVEMEEAAARYLFRRTKRTN